MARTRSGGGGGGAESVGGIEATVSVDTAGVEPGLRSIRANLLAVESGLERVGARGAAATHQLDTGVGRAGRALGDAGRHSAHFARGIMEVSRGVEDFTTGGPIGVLNNIPQIMTSMAAAAGVSATAVAGLTAGVSFLATGAYILYRNWDTLTEAFGQSKTLTEAEAMDELAKKTKLTADEQQRLNRYKREEATLQDQLNRRPKAEGEVTREVAAAVGEMGGAELQGQITRALLKEMSGKVTDAEVEARLRQEIATSGGTMSGVAIMARRGGLRQQMESERRKANEAAAAKLAGQLMANAEKGPGRLGEDARRRLGGLLPGEEGDIFRDPTKGPREKKAEEQRKRFIDAAKRGIKAREKIEAEEIEANKKRLDPAYQEGLRAKAEEEATVKGADVEEKAAGDEVAEMKRGNAERERENARLNRQFLRDEEERERLTDRGGDLTRRLRDLTEPAARQSRVMDAAALNASIQASVSNDDPMRRLQESFDRARKELHDIKTQLGNLGPPVKVGP